MFSLYLCRCLNIWNRIDYTLNSFDCNGRDIRRQRNPIVNILIDIENIVYSKDVLIDIKEITIFKDRYIKYKVSILILLYRSINL